MADDEQRQLPHVYLSGHGDREDFTSPRSGGGGSSVPLRERAEHAKRLEGMLTAAVGLAGEQIAARDRGSLHSDIWRGTATDLANRNGIGVCPVGGWWREKPKLERANCTVRYALIITLRAEVDINLHAEIISAVGIELDVDAGIA